MKYKVIAYLIIKILLIYPEDIKANSTVITSNQTLSTSRILTFAPHMINPNFFSFEFGYLIRKDSQRINYGYNAFAKAFISEEYYTQDEDLRGASLGVKGGILLPTQPWFPLYLEASFGYAKSTLHHRPWFGKRDNAQKVKNKGLIEIGAAYAIRNGFLLRATYHFNNLSYLNENFNLSVGYTF